jgi:hypothetical protein
MEDTIAAYIKVTSWREWHYRYIIGESVLGVPQPPHSTPDGHGVP